MGTDLQTNSSALSIIILVPALASIVMLFLWSPARVFRTITLAILMICPAFYVWKIKLLPPVHFTDAVLWPLGITMFLRVMARWRFSLIDLWVGLFVLSSSAIYLLKGQTTNSIFELLYAFSQALIPYMAGKLLIEQDGGRLPFIKNLLMLSLFVAMVGSVEWEWRVNPFESAFNPLFGGAMPGFGTQIRGGHGRVSAAFFSGELAGTVWIMALLLGVFAARYYGWGMRQLQMIPWRRSTFFSGMMLIALYLTQSRGPELGLVFGAPVAWVGQTRRIARNALLVALIMFTAGPIAFKVLTDYAAAGAKNAPTSDEQETAAYRIIMLDLYLPSAEHGGLFGQGKEFPKVGKYISIDNEYLLVWLVQGYVGLGSFLLVSLGTIVILVQTARSNILREDRALAFTLLGIFLAILVDVATVYLGLQPEVFFFLIAGWAQAIRVRPITRTQPVFDRIYT